MLGIAKPYMPLLPSYTGIKHKLPFFVKALISEVSFLVFQLIICCMAMLLSFMELDEKMIKDNCVAVVDWAHPLEIRQIRHKNGFSLLLTYLYTVNNLYLAELYTNEKNLRIKQQGT